MRPKSSGAVVATALLLAAGCGGGDETAAPPAESVEATIFEGGIEQNVRCEPAPELKDPGEDRAVFRCSFEEEQDVSGAMRMSDRCYALEEGELVDVTRALPVGTSCAVASG